MTYELQQLHTLEDSTAGNWEAVAAMLSASIPQPGVKASSKRTFGAIVQAKYDPDKIIGGFTSSESGKALIAKLNADSDGIDWSDSLTGYILDKIVSSGSITADVAVLLRSLSARSTTLAGGAVVSAEQCQSDWEAGVRVEADAALITSKQAALAEANDVAIHLISGNAEVSQDDIVKAVTDKLTEQWPK